MSMDWVHLTVWTSLGGGAMIGLAVAILFIGTRRIAGISGILGEVLGGARGGWRWVFLMGLLAAPWVVASPVGLVGEARFGVPWPILFLAGVLTGYGTRLARGCTSGHGVCGLSRLSRRSLVAVVCFMASGMVTVTVLRLFAGAAS